MLGKLNNYRNVVDEENYIREDKRKENYHKIGKVRFKKTRKKKRGVDFLADQGPFFRNSKVVNWV